MSAIRAACKGCGKKVRFLRTYGTQLQIYCPCGCAASFMPTATKAWQSWDYIHKEQDNGNS